MGNDRTGMNAPRARGAKRVTSIDVAAHAGVSQATVARVFSSPELVAAATREKVEASAVELGYVPNAIARSLKSQRTNIIGAVVPTVGEYWQSVLTAFSRQLAARKQQLLLFSFNDPAQLTTVLRSVTQYRVDGLILASANIDPSHLHTMASGPVPVVAFNQPAAAGVVPSVSVDNDSGMRELANHLVDVGADTVHYVGGLATASTDQIRYRGASVSLAGAGIACPYTEAGGFTYDHGYRVAAELVVLGELPDAFMVAGDELAFGVIDGLEDRGVHVPHDVMVTGFDGLPQASWAGYDLTTLMQPTETLVERAVDLLLDPAAAGSAEVFEPGLPRLGRTTKSASTPDQENFNG